jgi:murein L,D-transpeptidase YcbB/YkuD
MNTGSANHKYTAIVVVTVVMAGFFAGTLATNVYRMLSEDRAPIGQAVIGKAEPQTIIPEPDKTLPKDTLRPRIAALLEQETPANYDAVKRVYETFSYAPLWVKAPGALKHGKDRLKNLAQAAEAANAQAITTTQLDQLITTALKPGENQDLARLDIDLTRESLRLATAFRLGAVAREKLGRSWVMPADSFDPAPALAAAVKDGDVEHFLAGLAPQDAQYRALTVAYKTYRELAARGDWTQIPAGEEIKFGTADPRLALVRERLAAEGYIKYKNDDLAAALIAFQNRNGLEPDGRIGRGTLAALNVPVKVRLAQIAANMERHRHTPRELGDRHIAVNTAAATLELIDNGKSLLRMNVVAGSKRHATPILSATVNAVTLNPRWEIPRSIATREILPKLQANPRYLAENNMTIVDGVAADSSGESIDWSQYTADEFPMRLRQLAGDDNALGVLKFQMSNPQNIYLHDTPSRTAFSKFERHLSHGCIRLGQPVTLAAAVLAASGWNEDSINTEIAQGGTRTIAVKNPVQVHISYWTVFTQDDALHFRNDIYARDESLAAALGQGLNNMKIPSVEKTVAAD